MTIKVNPYLNFNGNCEEVFEFYRSVFGGEFSSLVRFGEFPMEGFTPPAGTEQLIMHMALPIGDDIMLMGSDTIQEFGQDAKPGTNLYISLHPDSKQEADRLFNGLSMGGDVEMPIADAPWGDYWGSFKDKFGICWMVNYSPPRD